MTRPADVSPSYGPNGTAYLVQCGGSSKDRLFHELKPALRYAKKHNNKHHHGAVPQYHEWNNHWAGLPEEASKNHEKNT
ncbi:MAG TPA: hypothetical protein VJQ60_09265 [Arthrobacter sp.]|nr:hypothetical protein [Arthrobacter sp.]